MMTNAPSSETTSTLNARDIRATNVVAGQLIQNTFNVSLDAAVMKLVQAAVAAQTDTPTGLPSGVTQSPALESAMVAMNAKQYERAIAYAEQVLAEGREKKNLDLQASAEFILGGTYSLSERPREAIPHLEKLLALLPTDKPSLTRVQVAVLLGSAHGEANDAAEAERYFDLAHEQAAQFNEPAVLIFYEQSVASWYSDRGDARGALPHLEGAEAAAKRLSLSDQVAFFASQRASMYHRLEDWAACAEAGRQALTAMTEQAPLLLRHNALCAIVIAAQAQNDVDAILAFGPRQIGTAIEMGNSEMAMGMYRRLSFAFFERQLHAQNIVALEKTVELAKSLNKPDVELPASVDLGYAYGNAGWIQQALAMFERTGALARLQRNPTLEARSLAGLALGKSDVAERISLLEQALVIAQAARDAALADQIAGWLATARSAASALKG